MQNVKNTTLVAWMLLLSFGLLAQPDCPILISPMNNAVDQELTITFEWSAAPTGDVPTNYILSAGETSGNLTQLFSGNETSATISSFFDLGKTYYWQVIAESAGGSSSGCSENVFSTISIPQPSGVTCGNGVTEVSVTEDMESETGWTGDISASTNLTWQLDSGTTPSGGTGNTGPASAHSGSSYFYYESSSSSETSPDASLISPAIDLTAASGTVDMSFYMFAYGTGIHSLSVGVSTSATGPFTNLWSWNGPLQTNQSDPWQLVGLDVSAYAGQTIYVEFLHVATASGGFLGDLAVDLLQFDGCEMETAPNDDCSTAMVLAEAGEPGSLAGQSTEFATDSGLAAASCGSSPTKDVYYSIETDIDGGGLNVDITSGPSSKFTAVLYENSCGSLVELACATAAATGDDVNLYYFVPNTLVGKEGNNNRFTPQNLTVRVFDENNANETFSIDATGTSLAALPVQLTDWKASLQDRSVLLSWQTAQEFNTEKFVVEKSFDGKRWFEVHTEKAIGFSNIQQTYEFEDLDLSVQQMYRLRIIDFDGFEELSKIIRITREDLSIEIYPNPAVDVIQIDLGERQEDVQIRIVDLSGREIWSGKNQSGNPLDVSNLEAGMYRILIEYSGGFYQQSFMKQ